MALIDLVNRKRLQTTYTSDPPTAAPTTSQPAPAPTSAPPTLNTPPIVGADELDKRYPWRPSVPTYQTPQPTTATDFYRDLWSGISGGPKTAPSFYQPNPGTQTDQGWIYPWRSEPYQGPLNPRDIEQQQQEYAYRAANPGVKLPEDSVGLWEMIQPGGAGRTGYDFGNMPGFQFDDPYTKQLEDLIKQSMNAIQQPQANPALDKLNAFLDQRFGELTSSPGYSPEELAILRTQFLEPIERDRAAGRQRVEERTAARGMLPSSGLHEQDLQQFVDQPAMEARTAAQRDLAINAMNRRRGDLDQALNLGRVAGIEIPGFLRGEDQQRRSEMLNLASLLYDLPNRAQQQAMQVLGGSPGPQDLFSQSIQLQQAQQQQQALNAQKWTQIGQWLAGWSL